VVSDTRLLIHGSRFDSHWAPDTVSDVVEGQNAHAVRQPLLKIRAICVTHNTDKAN